MAVHSNDSVELQQLHKMFYEIYYDIQIALIMDRNVIRFWPLWIHLKHFFSEWNDNAQHNTNFNITILLYAQLLLRDFHSSNIFNDIC